MRRCHGPLAVAASLALALGSLPAFAGVSGGTEKSRLRVEALLTGDDEVPPVALAIDPIEADLILDPRRETVCFDIDVDEDDLDDVVSAHIHAGEAGTADEDRVLVDLDFPNQGFRGCVRAGRFLLESIRDDVRDIDNDEPEPPSFYLHLHTAQFPTGAVRGQLFEDLPEPEPEP